MSSYHTPDMIAHDNSLIACVLQSDYVSSEDRGVCSVPVITGDEYSNYGWESTSGSASGYHRNYMDKRSKGKNYLTVDMHGKVRLYAVSSLDNLAGAV
ncbi:hypothetical protein ACH5RR_023547 [Cinchona calisaya]|uniref:Uncharacterized protein n=1 Tax=Cinchona calisaya TaxID=153742 RepID=A0ABD2ZEF3_9GENT